MFNKDFYPTPENLISKMFSKVNKKSIKNILEPSAGKGNIVDYLKNLDPHNRYRNFETDCIEQDKELQNFLKGKGHRLIFDDFLNFNTSKAYVEFSQGLDIRLMTEEKIKYLNKIKLKMLHFAWDNYEMKTYEKLKKYRNNLNFTTRQLGVYVLVNFNTSFTEDLDRVYKLRELGYSPYIMRYLGPEAKEKIKKGE